MTAQGRGGTRKGGQSKQSEVRVRVKGSKKNHGVRARQLRSRVKNPTGKKKKTKNRSWNISRKKSQMPPPQKKKPVLIQRAKMGAAHGEHGGVKNLKNSD